MLTLAIVGAVLTMGQTAFLSANQQSAIMTKPCQLLGTESAQPPPGQYCNVNRWKKIMQQYRLI